MIDTKGLINKMTSKPRSFARLGFSIAMFGAATVILFWYRDWVVSLNLWWFLPLWLYFVFEAIRVIFPVFNVSIAAGKHLVRNFKPSEYFNVNKIKGLVVDNKHPLVIGILWCLMLAGIGVLYFTGIIDYLWMYYLALFFHMCDNICINIWCPFRTYMKNRCCVTCRIYNWDHLMKYSPLIFVPTVCNYILVGLGIIALVQWEVTHKQHPERFYQITNTNLNCGNCKRNCIRQRWVNKKDTQKEAN